MKTNRSWMEYEYRYLGANENNKMWMRDNQRILQIGNKEFAVGNSSHVFEGTYNTFKEAETMLAANG